MKQMDYGLLMRRVMAQLEILGAGATQQLSPTPKEKGHDSSILSGEHVVRTDDNEVIFASVYWLQDRWHRATSDDRRVEVLRIALSVLRHVRVRVKPNHDRSTLDGRLAIGREIAAGEMSVVQAAERYGFSRQHGYDLRDQAVAEDRRLAGGRERRRYAGTLEQRLAIAATPGTTKEVAFLYDVSQKSVSRWRVSSHLDNADV